MSSELIDILWTGTLDTLYMMAISVIVANLIGFPLGIILTITDKNHILPMKKTNKIIGTIVNIFRSFPLIILIVILIPVSRFLVGTTLGATAATVPLSIASAPIIARIFESSLKQVETGKIEAAKSMGADIFSIIVKVIIPESLPSIIRGITLSSITILGFTAISGAIGAGGLGSLAIRYGYQRFREDILWATVIVLVILVQGIQFAGDLTAKHINKKRHKFD